MYMKLKHISCYVVCVLLCFSSIEAHAQSTTVRGCVEIPITLRFGSRDASTNHVANLQAFLVSKGYLSDTPTGFYGNKTVAAVKEFQKANKIESTGIAGPLTRAKIREMVPSCSQIVTVTTQVINNGNSSTAITTETVTTNSIVMVPVVKDSTVVAPDLTWKKIEAKNITKNTVKLEAELTTDKSYVTYVKWGRNGEYDRRTGGVEVTSKTRSISYDISGLLPNTTYNYQFFVEGISTAQKVSVTGIFTTSPEGAPTEVTTSIEPPRIDSLSAYYLQPNTSFTIHGSNFLPKGNTVYISSNDLKLTQLGVYNSPDGKKIQLVLPWSVFSTCAVATPNCVPTETKILPGYHYIIYVTNINGKSAAETINVI